MEEEFYATIKLMSGEEIVAKVCYDEDEDVLILENPRLVTNVEIKKNNVTTKGFTFNTWIAATYDEMFIIKRQHIITITELDSRIKNFYEKHLLNENEESTNKVDIKKQKGYVTSIKEARKILEDIFNRS
jgi:adenylate kinase family enzyme